VKLVRFGRHAYETADKRFHVARHKKQGARSCYRVFDRKTEAALRAFTLEEVRTTIRDMLANDRLPDRLPVVHVSFQDGAPVFQAEGAAWAVRIPNEGAKIVRRVVANTVYLAVREVRHRMMGSREDARFEAELRELVGDAYVTIGRVSRSTRATAIEAARALAKRRGWHVSDKRIGWTTRDASYERAIAAEGPEPAPKPRKPSMPPPLLFTEFVIEMYEILREARETQATDARGRDIELYYGDMMRRLEGALDLVNDRIVRRSLGGVS
jgi:hypothetical protein